MKRPSFTDKNFIMLEKRQAPQHLGALFIFKLPEKSDHTFFDHLMKKFHTGQRVAPPFNQILSSARWRFGQYEWRTDRSFDLDYHLRHIALPNPGDMQQLYAVISRIHGQMLDRSRPLWEFYIIEGLEDNRFALYLKIHHVLLDGAAAVKLVLSCFSNDPEDTTIRPIWQGRLERWQRDGIHKSSFWQRAETLPVTWAKRLQSTSELTRHAAKMTILSNLLGEDTVPYPSIAPRTRFNKKISAQRRLATHTLPLADIKKIGKLTDSTINDVLLAICSGALRRYLQEHRDLPSAALIGWIPVALEESEGSFSATRITSINCNLGTNIDHPQQRLAKIKTSMNKNKELLAPLSGTSKEWSTLLVVTRTVLTHVSEQVDRIPPSCNLAISNVVGPKMPLYLNGARLETTFPISVLFHGLGLNITAVSYAGEVCFGLVACRNLLPDLNKMAEYIGTSFDELKTSVMTKGKDVFKIIAPAKTAGQKEKQGNKNAERSS